MMPATAAALVDVISDISRASVSCVRQRQREKARRHVQPADKLCLCILQVKRRRQRHWPLHQQQQQHFCATPAIAALASWPTLATQQTTEEAIWSEEERSSGEKKGKQCLWQWHQTLTTVSSGSLCSVLLYSSSVCCLIGTKRATDRAGEKEKKLMMRQIVDREKRGVCCAEKTCNRRKSKKSIRTAAEVAAGEGEHQAYRAHCSLSKHVV